MGQIVVENLGKAYKVYPSKLERLKEWLIPFSKSRHQYHWVLQDLNFEVKPGEAVGIIGINGAGKSTLLKMITGTTQPTTGSVNISGRVAALLELGMGFHPDFTGRQNVFMAGQLLGYNKGEIETLMPDIESFAEIGEYIDQPVRVYSSGMQMRLAFSVATAKRPDVLIVDEALSVGDAFFQHKSFQRIKEFSKEGTTLLLVSHDKAAIQSICTRAILLNNGEVDLVGKPDGVFDHYNALLSKPTLLSSESHNDALVKTSSGSGEIEITQIGLFDENGEPVGVLGVGDQVTLKISFRAITEINRLVIGIMIKDRLGQTVFGVTSENIDENLINVKKSEVFRYSSSFKANIGEGKYSISVAFSDSSSHVTNNYLWQDHAYYFEVINKRFMPFVGGTFLNASQAIERADDTQI